MSEMNGHNVHVPPGMPQGDPQVIRVLQHALQLAQQGSICGVAIISISGDGQAHQSVALPQAPPALLLTIGAMESTKLALLDNIKAMQNPANVSKILKPGAFQSR